MSGQSKGKGVTGIGRSSGCIDHLDYTLGCARAQLGRLTILGMSSLDGLGDKKSGSLRSSVCNDSTIGLQERGEDFSDDWSAFAIEAVSEKITGAITGVGVGDNLGSPKRAHRIRSWLDALDGIRVGVCP